MTFVTDIKGTVSTDNSYEGTASSYSGTYEDVSQYTQITVTVYSERGTTGSGLKLIFSSNNLNVDTEYIFTLLAGSRRIYTYTVVAKYFKVNFTGVSSGDIRIQTIYHNTKNSTVIGEHNKGITNSYINNSASAFGELHAVQIRPLVELDYVYGLNNLTVGTFTSSGANVIASTSNLSHIEISTSAAANKVARLFSKDIANYRPGQGIDIRFTAIFTTGVSNSTQIIGVGNAEDGYFFGYNGTDFGVLRRHGGIRKVVTFTISTAATTTGTVGITLNSTLYNVSVTNQANKPTVTAYEIAENGDFTGTTPANGWEATANGNVITFIALDADGTRNGSYSYSAGGTGIIIVIDSTVTTGVSTTNEWMTQTNWNKDQALGFTTLPIIDFTKGNVYRITYQWLGYGNISFYIEDPTTGKFECVHSVPFANTDTNTSTANPKLPLMAESRNDSNTSNIVIKSPSMCALLSGNLPINIPYRQEHSVFHTNTTLSANDHDSLLSIRNKPTYGTVKRFSYVTIFLDSISIYNQHSKPILIRLIKNCAFDAIISGTLTWQDVNSANSVTQYNEVIAPINTTYSGIEVFSFIVNTIDTVERDLTNINLILKSNETLTISAFISDTSSNKEIFVSLNWHEDI